MEFIKKEMAERVILTNTKIVKIEIIWDTTATEIKKRVQTFEGVVIGRSGNGVDATFTIRKLGANNIGVERIFPLYCESLKTIEVLRKGDVRRAKLNYLRALKGKAAKIKELKR